VEAIEKQLALAIDELIDEVIELYPNLRKSLAKIQPILRAMVVCTSKQGG
jgi:hypothetical protein